MKPESDPGAPDQRAKDADCSAVPPLLTLFKQTAMLIGNLTPSPRQLHVAEGEGKREITVVTGDNYSL